MPWIVILRFARTLGDPKLPADPNKSFTSKFVVSSGSWPFSVYPHFLFLAGISEI
jgi:hypothetical protein